MNCGGECSELCSRLGGGGRELCSELLGWGAVKCRDVCNELKGSVRSMLWVRGGVGGAVCCVGVWVGVGGGGAVNRGRAHCEVWVLCVQ